MAGPEQCAQPCAAGDHLRRASALSEDLAEVGGTPHTSPATRAYVAAIDAAAAEDNASGGARLLGHVYCRYFADLFGGQALAVPTRLALALGPGSPRHYDFGAFVSGRRREAIEELYERLNDAGDALAASARDAVVGEARRAFALNVEVYRRAPHPCAASPLRPARAPEASYTRGLRAAAETCGRNTGRVCYARNTDADVCR